MKILENNALGRIFKKKSETIINNFNISNGTCFCVVLFYKFLNQNVGDS